MSNRISATGAPGAASTASGRIQILAPEIANLIAAGEVVERPASIVKELIENAIDADALEIRVDIEGGGLQRITVVDDGSGMSPEEAQLAVQRHATSKIRVAEDLANIRTLGFRGEALPSIAAVSRFSLTTMPRQLGTGTCSVGVRLTLAGGEPPVLEEVGCRPGTEIAIRELFFNTPARRKFLKGERTEFAHIHEVVNRFALAYPRLRFQLTHNGRTVVAAHAVGRLDGRIAELFGADTMGDCVPLDVGGPGLRLEGYCGRPILARAGAPRSYCYVNGRPVRDRVLLHAIAEGYRTYLPKGEQPFIVLFLTIDPAEVDVNVHPAKAEVRFANPGGVHHFVATAIQRQLAQGSTVPPPAPYPLLFGRAAQGTGDTNPVVQETLSLYPPVSQSPSNAPKDNLRTHAPTHLRTESFRPIGQLAELYLLYEGSDGTLLVVDQHAAHERIGFERLKAQQATGGVSQQLLLPPLVVELTPTQAAALAESQLPLRALGCDIEPFGGTTVAVKSVPALLGTLDVRALIVAIAEELVTYGQAVAITAQLDRLLATMACHRQVRAGDRLHPEELAALVGEMAEGVSKERCPHGRPTWVAIPARELGKWFQRT